MIDDIEILEKLQAPQRELSAYVEHIGERIENDNFYATIVAARSVSPEQHTITGRYELNNLLEINNYAIKGETTVSLENPIPAGNYQFSGILSNNNTSTFNYVNVGFIYDNGHYVVRSYTAHSTNRKISTITLERTVVAIRFGNADYPNIQFIYKELMISKYNGRLNYTPYKQIASPQKFFKGGLNLFPQRTVTTNTQYPIEEVELECTLLPGSWNIRIGSALCTDNGITQCHLKFMHLNGGGYDLVSVDLQTAAQNLSIDITQPCHSVILGNESVQDAAFTFEDVSISRLLLYEYHDYVKPVIITGTEDNTFTTDSFEGVDGITIWAVNSANIYYSNIEHQIVNKYAILNTFWHDGDLISFQVDSMGENKFFGYGITRKLTLKIRDIERAYKIEKGQILQYTLDDYYLSPPFDIYEVTRDENTNEITVIAYDKCYRLREHTAKELDLVAPYTIDDLIYHIMSVADGGGEYYVTSDEVWNELFYNDMENGINISGTETLKEIMDDIAEYTGCIYYEYDGELVFACMDKRQQAVLTITQDDYFTLETKGRRRIGTIATVTDLGNNVSYKYTDGETVYLHNNCVFDNSTDMVAELENRALYLGGFTMDEFTLDWRGNYLLDLGDCIEIEAKDGSYILTYLVNDTLIYNGGLRQITKWQLDSSTTASTNPTTLGEAIKETYAKVDKQEKRIDLVASEAAANSSNIASLQLTTNGITASVVETNKATQEALENINGDITELTEKVNLTMSAEDVKLEIQKEIANGTSRVETSTGFTFDDVGLTISKSSSDIETTITEDGMVIMRNGAEVLTANNEGVKAIDLHATTFLIIGKNSRLEDYGNRTACFWIGGSN